MYVSHFSLTSNYDLLLQRDGKVKVFNEEMESFVQNKMKDNNGQKYGEL